VNEPGGYQCRFVPNTITSRAELVNLYHLARTALARATDNGRRARMAWAATSYASEHPEVTALAAYKDLEGLLA
jgi:hypothetical protein